MVNLIMDPLMKLPLDLEEDILSGLPVRSLARFKTVCKQWNSLLNNKRFMSLARPQFIFQTNSKTFMIDIIGLNSTEPNIHKSEIPSLNRYPCYQDSDVSYTTITPCDDFLFCNSRFQNNRVAIWSPGLSQLKQIKYKVEQSQFYVCGLGYDHTRPEKVYKILGHFLLCHELTKTVYQRVAIYECVSQALRYIYTPHDEVWPLKVEGDTRTHVSLNGDLYWITNDPKTHDYFIRSFDFSREIFKTFCILPCKKNYSSDELVLSIFKGDRFSLLNYSYVARKIDILVTKKKIDREEEVVWMNLMTLATTNLPKLLSRNFVRTSISYYIYDKSLVMCCGSDESGEACIYIVRGDMCKKIELSAMYFQCCHCVYAPNAASLPSV